ncbi:hypothetical protein LSTR_LSTR010814 [Laodelphax striatellus]|uniref:TBC1 domain family member 31 n=1 Tax=Laodelphax striatellus TaxID=195883 RepID=A0A482XKN8_LAOST|nr:hypothetical protein LSTR_LSTR010814 [Laodelphax striatellus]
METKHCLENPTGEIFKKPFRIDTSRKDGLLLQIHHTIAARNKKSRTFKFDEATFDDTGEQLAAIDHVGNIVVIDFSCLRFWMLPSKLKCSVMKFSSYKKNELLLGRPGGNVALVDTGSGVLSSNLIGHKEPVSHITFATGEPCCLTVSKSEAIIWNLPSNSKLHRLALHSDVSYRQIFFIPVSNNIFACFDDNTVHVWKFKTFECVKYSLPHQWNNQAASLFSVTRDGQTIGVGGSSSKVMLMSLETCRMKKVLQLPKYINSITHLEFIPQPFDGGSNKVPDYSTISSIMKILQSYTFLLFFWCSCIIFIFFTNFMLQEESSINQLFLLQMGSILDINRLKQILDEYLEYPESYRPLIWKTILRLPQNQLAYNALQKKGLHPVCGQFNENFLSSKSTNYSNSLKRLISCLSHWSPLFSQITYLPNLVSPFLKVFKSNSFTCFEFVATFIVNWCQRWFEFFPFPPVNVMSMIENILVEWDEELFNWFVEQQVTSHQYGWTILQSLFSLVLGQKEWMQLFDHILSNEPSFIIFALVAYLIVCRSTLLKIANLKDFEFFFHNQTAINMRHFIKKIYHLYYKTKDDDSHPKSFLQSFKPLQQGETYQIFNEYPKFIVDKQADHINNMREELTELLEEQSRLARARAEQEKRHALEINRQAQKVQLMNLQKQYQDALAEDEDRISQQMKRVNLLKKDLKHRERLMTEEARSRTQDLITQQRTAALQALINEIDSKRAQEERKLREIEEETLDRHQQLLLEKQRLEQQLAVLAEAPIPVVSKQDELGAQLAELSEQLMKIRGENCKMSRKRDLKKSRELSTADSFLQKAEFELAQEVAERQKTMWSSQHNIQAMKLETETKDLQNDVDEMHNSLLQKRLQESWDLLKATRESRDERMVLQKELAGLTDALQANAREESGSDDTSTSTASAEVLWKNRIYHPSSSSFNTFHGYDLRGRDTDYYRRQQDAIKSSLDIRQRLLSQQNT